MTLRRQAPASSKPLAFLSLLFLLVVSFTAPSFLARAEPMPPADAGLVKPGDMTTGALLLKSEDGYVEAPRLATDIVTTVNGTIARTVVVQRFENPGDDWLEGIYVFPLPEQSAVDALRMEIGDRVIEGEIKGRDDAKALYEAAKDAGQKASLVEQERPNIFTNSVANIGPRETVVIRIEYQETVKQDGGAFSLRFPLVVAPRYNPAPSGVNVVDFGGTQVPSDPVPDRDRITPPVLDPAKAGKINPVSIEVKLNAGFVLGDVASAFHKISLTRTGDETATLKLADGTVPADKDFELTWRPKGAATPQTALFHEVVNGQDYLVAMVTPPTLDAAPKVLPREIIFVIDNSGSMAGTSIVQAKQSLLLALDRLRPGDKFNVIRFDDTMDTVFPAPVDATAENLAVAKHFVSRLDAEGGTEMLPALKAALADLTPADTSRLRQVVFLTDGSVGNEAQLFAEIAANLGRSRLFTVGIGSAPNSYFMRQASELGRGTFTHIGSDAQVLERMSELFAKLEKPVMVSLKAEWPAGTTVEVWPNPLPDLYAGEPVVLAAKVGAMTGELRLSGLFDGKPWTAALRLGDAIGGEGVAKLWARSKIAALEAKAATDFMATGIDKQIEAVALEHHLVSSQTSLVAIDTMKTRPDGTDVTTTNLPLNLPDGWVYDKVFGTAAPVQRALSPQLQNMAAAQAQLQSDPGYALAKRRQALAFDPSQALPASPPLPTADAATAPADSAALEESEAATADEAYPVLPLTVVPKPAPEPSALPQATLDLNQRIAIFLFLLTFLSGLTLILWRQERRAHDAPRRARRVAR
ncbi:MAG: marine proteobacterial sortase target protein [Methyloceanibacter sp.]|uniref:marine proteobacterial sortase target protein n=1 Tax=Methyloceanibacter sp. TaxID=1965321 RepID=UPI003D6D0C22